LHASNFVLLFPPHPTISKTLLCPRHVPVCYIAFAKLVCALSDSCLFFVILLAILAKMHMMQHSVVWTMSYNILDTVLHELHIFAKKEISYHACCRVVTLKNWYLKSHSPRTPIFIFFINPYITVLMLSNLLSSPLLPTTSLFLLGKSP
jgi:hypothetical protein